MITSEVVQKSIDYIIGHLDDAITIEDVARHCHFSKFHLCRLFKNETGESLYAFIKRLKLEQSAIKLKLEKNKNITEIGEDFGYSPSNYSSAFKKFYQVCPAEFRQGSDKICMNNPFNPDNQVSFQSFEYYAKAIKIMELTDFLVLYERHLGNYIELGQCWLRFTERYKELIKDDTLLIEKFYDDPAITSVKQCLFDICLTVDEGCSYNNVTKIPGGKYAVYRFDGLIKDIFAAYQGVYNIWLAASGHEMRERYSFGIYRKMDRENQCVAVDLCIPIK